MPVKLSSLPDPPKEYVVDLPKLNGGLNLWDLDYRMDANQSPDMQNLYWLDGALASRQGQSWITAEQELGMAYTCFSDLFWDHVFLHIGDGIYYADGKAAETATDENPIAYTKLLEGVPENRGTFFRYGEDLMYKNRGGYYRIQYKEDGTFTAGDVEVYSPTTYINMEPTTHAGDEYQPENRLCPQKTVWYSVVEGVAEYHLPVTIPEDETEMAVDTVDKVIVDGVELDEVEQDALPTYPAEPETAEDGQELVTVYTGGQVTFTATATNSEATYQWQWRTGEDGEWDDCTEDGNNTGLMTVADLTTEQTGYQYRCAFTDGEGNVTYSDGFVLYVRPVATCYAVDYRNGIVIFDAEPRYHNPYVANTVKITYTKVDEETTKAYNSIMDCQYAAVYGGDQNLCVVLGGCPAQPNAYFWCGNHIAMDAGYFPFEQYNFAGDTEEHITGFGKQQNLLVIFKERSLGRAEFSTTEMASGRVMIQMPYTRINDRIGCDLPWSIQLVQNNLVFCNKESGVHFLKDSSAAYENNVVDISRNVNGGERKLGLLNDVRLADVVTSYNDGDRYWLVANGAAYVWDFTLSSYSDPSWFYFTNIHAVAFFKENEFGYHVNAAGRLTALRNSFMDYDEPIPKVYQFAAQTMGGYDRLKDVLSVIFVVRADTNSLIHVTYLTDYEEREDLTPIRAFSWMLSPRNLAHRFLGVTRFATVARRKPNARHVRHFSMRLESCYPVTDMSVISAQIFYRYQGRDR